MRHLPSLGNPQQLVTHHVLSWRLSNTLGARFGVEALSRCTALVSATTSHATRSEKPPRRSCSGPLIMVMMVVVVVVVTMTMAVAMNMSMIIIIDGGMRQG